MKANIKIQNIKTPLLFLYLLVAEIIVMIFFLSAKPGGAEVVVVRGGKDVALAKNSESKINVLSAAIQRNICYLSWITNKEESDGYYVIERYKTSDSSQYIGMLPAKGGEKILYSFEDKNYPTWKCFYRVWFVGCDDSYFESDYIIPEPAQVSVRNEIH